jgi:sec-independent protein translocase protein TatC
MLNYITAPVNAAIKQYYEERRNSVGKGSEAPDHPLNKPVVMKIEISAEEMLRLARKVAPQAQLPEKPAPDAPTEVMTVKLLNPAWLTMQQMEVQKKIDKGDNLTALSATEAFVVWMLVSLVLGLIISSPLVLYELWSFVATGLYPHEKNYVYYLLPTSIVLFFAGVLVCQFFIMPAALEALFSFNAWLEIDPDLRLREWLGFAIMMPLITGICFQTPLVMLFLGKIGIFTAADFLAKWKIAVFILLIFAAIVSPSVDAVSLFILWVPMSALYFLGILFVRMVEK